MGVLKFFKWLLQRHPILNREIIETDPPKIDNLYLDTNCIIHNCSRKHRKGTDKKDVEDKVINHVLRCIDELIRVVRPKNLIFIAIDGVAPMAKLRGQRERRALAASKTHKKREESEESNPEAKSEFNRNAITPGTEFMEKLLKELHLAVSSRVNSNSSWKKCKVIISGPRVPGEGEHKIIGYMREQLSQAPSLRHCIYGSDADLIILGLCTHLPCVSVLREDVQRVNGRIKRKFIFVDLKVYRELIDMEFEEVKEKITFPYSLQNIIDDWMVLTFLVGNDFIPKLSYFSVSVLPLVYRKYKSILPELNGYITCNGELHLNRYEKLLSVLADIPKSQKTSKGKYQQDLNVGKSMQYTKKPLAGLVDSHIESDEQK
ncbi:5'-3' exoribonuclease 1-like [Artemia franciscana]|uniref:Xrn1 N-terminal domain-containing protein n=1 Tax=Artemia franciscana TaxID=6661 RepID=A0AA88HI72_ARTSF|nr:hypothetical protein QYM36_016212 [Artemia franciscana]